MTKVAPGSIDYGHGRCVDTLEMQKETKHRAKGLLFWCGIVAALALAGWQYLQMLSE
jgi:hypothetical protein